MKAITFLLSLYFFACVVKNLLHVQGFALNDFSTYSRNRKRTFSVQYTEIVLRIVSVLIDTALCFVSVCYFLSYFK